MKPTKFVLFFALMTVTFGCRQMNSNYRIPTFKGYSFCDNIPINPENYKTICECVKLNRQTFPMNTVLSGKIFKNNLNAEDYYKKGFFEKGNSFEIDTTFVTSFKAFTADSMNFSWGELGTTYTDYIIEFYDSNRKLINQADISYDGMVWTSPEFGITKLGLLTQKGEFELKNLMNKYTTEKKN